MLNKQKKQGRFYSREYIFTNISEVTAFFLQRLKKKEGPAFRNIGNTSTWIFENRVSKHFVISLTFHCLSLLTVLFAYVVLCLFCG